MKNFCGAIFDVDGTLLDSMGIWYRISDEFFKAHNVVIPHEKLAEYQSLTLEQTLPLINEEYMPDVTVEEMVAEITQRAARLYEYEIPAKPGACQYLKTLHERGVKIAVATSGFEKLCKAAFRRLGVIDVIDTYAFSSEVGCDKSQPDIYVLAADRLGLAPSSCVVYEDIITGIRSAAGAGFCTVAIKDPSNAADTSELMRYADRYIVSWEELL